MRGVIESARRLNDAELQLVIRSRSLVDALGDRIEDLDLALLDPEGGNRSQGMPVLSTKRMPVMT